MKSTTRIDLSVRELYARFRKSNSGTLVGRDAEYALRCARTLARFNDLEADGLVRMERTAQSEDYFSVCGEPDTTKERKQMEAILERDGCWYVFSEYADESGNWHTADGVGMCVYPNPVSPFENCYVIDLMDSAIAKAEAALREPAERAHWEARDTVTQA